jgi:uncharacterized membrane protein
MLKSGKPPVFPGFDRGVPFIGIRFRELARFPVSAGVLLGIGLAGLLDVIVLRHVLQWHGSLTAATSAAHGNAAARLFWDGVYELAACSFVAAGIALLWVNARDAHVRWPPALLAASLATGAGIYLLAEGIVAHGLLALHHVNDTVAASSAWYWDAAFIACGAAMALGGCAWLSREIRRG